MGDGCAVVRLQDAPEAIFSQHFFVLKCFFFAKTCSNKKAGKKDVTLFELYCFL
jgi:hypothetical protein